MNEQVSPERPLETPEHHETLTDRVVEVATTIRRRAEGLGDSVQDLAGDLGDTAGRRAREAAEQARYYSEQARTEAASRLEEARHYVTRQADELGENSRETVRRYPEVSVGLALAAGFALALFGRRLIANMMRR